VLRAESPRGTLQPPCPSRTSEHDRGRQIGNRGLSAFHELGDPEGIPLAEAVLEVVEHLAVERIGRVHGVTLRPEAVGELLDRWTQAERRVEQDHFLTHYSLLREANALGCIQAARLTLGLVLVLPKATAR
jgi:hypothetical protein